MAGIHEVIEAGRLQAEHDDAHGVARFGGIWNPPSYQEAYLEAARRLIEMASAEGRVKEMAIPCTYLQRHALELILKGLLNAAYGIFADQQSIDATERSGQPTWFESQKVEYAHSLTGLAEALVPALSAIGYECPPAFAVLAREMSALENEDSSRLRYPTVRQKKQNGAGGSRGEAASFPEEVAIPVLRWQKQLDAIEREVLSIRGDDWDGTGTLVEELCLDARGQTQHMYELGLI